MKVFDVDCELVYAVNGEPADFIFNIEAAHHPDQRILEERLTSEPKYDFEHHVDAGTGMRLARLVAKPGQLTIRYRALVETRYHRPTGHEEEVPVRLLPLEVTRYLWPSRYCESDSLQRLAMVHFGDLSKGYGRVESICQWVRENVQYAIGTSTPSTSVRDVLVNRAGVCRDFAHLCIALCRALNIPARLVTGYAQYEDPPPDFHAMFEAYLGGRWILFDSTRLSPEEDLIRIATTRDAADAAFATLFGPIKFVSWRPDVYDADTRSHVNG
ncbi:MAG: transglutaminase family protein [Burkholderiales bacterium]